MTDIIHVLPDSVANQIAAGEVIQRPASVVKELLENAVDAGSDSITVKLKDAGKTSIQVVDNGCGMSETDARLAFERHSTSKIKQASDLFAIQTMGFRGEALASIASVSHLQLKSRRHTDEVGVRIDIEGSEVKKQEETSCPAGSTFVVKNLFFNVPARRKFLKKDSTELKHIIKEFQKVALSHHQIAFSLFHNNTEVYNLPKSSLKQRIINLFGKNLNQYLLSMDCETSIVTFKGFIGRPEHAKKKFGEQFFFVNGRYMRHPYFHKAITSAYEQMIPSDAIPSYFIYMSVDPEIIDINIHPTKTEIKFQDEQAIWQIIRATVKETLGKHNVVPSMDFDSESKIEIPPVKKDVEPNTPSVDVNQHYNPFEQEKERFQYSGAHQGKERNAPEGWEKLFQEHEGQGKGHESIPSASPIETETHNKEEVHYTETMISGSESPHSQGFFQLKGKYILTPVKSGMMLIDQKRAHERILFEHFGEVLRQEQGVGQQSLYPETMELDPSDYNLVCEIQDDLNALGFDIRDFGTNTIVINGVPGQLSANNATSVLERIIEEYKQTENDVKAGIREKVAQSLASASAIHYGTVLATEEMRELVDNLFACTMPNYSPRGDLVISIMSMEELDKRFKM